MTKNTDNPLVVMVVLNWNNFEDTKNAIKSLKNVGYSNKEILLVDNGSTDNSGTRLKNIFPNIHFIKNKTNKGYAGGNNVGIVRSIEMNADYILVMNNDITVDSSFLQPLVDIAEDEDKIGMVNPAVYYAKEPNKLQSFGGVIDFWKGNSPLIDRSNFVEGKAEIPSYTPVDRVNGACFLVKAELIESIGPFDESYFLLWEDVELSQRAREFGYRVVSARNSKVFHKVNASFEKCSKERQYYAWRNRLNFMKDYGSFYFYPTFIIFFLGGLIKTVLKCYFNQKGDTIKSILSSSLKGIKDALTGNMGRK